MTDFRLWLRSQNYAAETIRSYEHYVGRAQVMLGDLRRVTTLELELFLASLPPSPSSQRQAKKALNAYYLSRRGKNPAAPLVVPPEPARLPRPIAEHEYGDYITAADRLGGAHRLVGNMFGFSGCRFSELRFARWRQLELRGREPHWRIMGKGSKRRGSKERVIPLHPDLVTTLTWWRRVSPSGDYLLPGTRRPYIATNTLYGLHYDIVDAIDVGAVPHQMRHTVITLALDRGNTPRAVADFAGHASLSTLDAYAGLLPGRLRKVADSLGPAEPDEAA